MRAAVTDAQAIHKIETEDGDSKNDNNIFCKTCRTEL